MYPRVAIWHDGVRLKSVIGVVPTEKYEAQLVEQGWQHVADGVVHGERIYGHPNTSVLLEIS